MQSFKLDISNPDQNEILTLLTIYYYTAGDIKDAYHNEYLIDLTLQTFAMPIEDLVSIDEVKAIYEDCTNLMIRIPGNK